MDAYMQFIHITEIWIYECDPILLEELYGYL